MTNRPIIENGIKYFRCKKCGEVKPLNKSYFYVNMNSRLGFLSKCISCVKREVENKPKVKYITRAELEEENKELRGLQICGKTVAEWIEEDRDVVRVDKDGKVVSGGEFRELC